MGAFQRSRLSRAGLGYAWESSRQYTCSGQRKTTASSAVVFVFLVRAAWGVCFYAKINGVKNKVWSNVFGKGTKVHVKKFSAKP